MRKLLAIVCGLVLAASPVLAALYSVPNSTVAAGTTVTMLSAVTTGTGTVITTNYKVAMQTITLKWHGTCSGGSVVVEAADSATWDHTWAPMAPAISAHSNIEDVITIVVPTHSVRVRVASDVTGGGDLTVTYVGTNF